MSASTAPEAILSEKVEEIWRAPLEPLGCPACQRVFLAPQGYRGRPCPRCARATLEPQPAWLRPEPPEQAVPFSVDRGRLGQALERFTAGVWLAPEDFTPQSLLQRAVPLFWPMWLVDSEVEGDWETQAGYPYQVKSSQEYYAGGGWQSRDVVEDRLRWEPRVGQVRRRYENISVPALSDHAALTAKTGANEIRQAQAYHPQYLGGAAVCVPDLGQEAVWPLAEKSLRARVERDCQQAVDAQQLRYFVLRPTYSNLCWTQMLLPVYASYYTGDDGQPVWVYINGQSGHVGGPRLASQRRGWRAAAWIFAIGLLALLLGLLSTALTPVFPPAAAIGGLFVVIGLLAVILSAIPAIYPWQHNRRS